MSDNGKTFDTILAEITNADLVDYQEAGLIWRDGFVQGQADGVSLGFANAKLRVHLVLDSLEEARKLSRADATAVRDAFDAILGARLPRS
jgi:hypothetical protein